MKDIVQILIRNVVLVLISMAAAKGLLPTSMITDANVAEIANMVFLVVSVLAVMGWSWLQNHKNLMQAPPVEKIVPPPSSPQTGLTPPVLLFILLGGWAPCIDSVQPVSAAGGQGHDCGRDQGCG